MKQLLIVDDDLSMRMALSESLESFGYAVETAENGADGLNRFREHAFDAVITDMRMPRMSGMDVLRGVKRISFRTPVIVITAYGTVNTAVEAMKEGAADFIMKPFSLDDLESVVKNVLNARPKDSGDESEASEERIGPGFEIITRSRRILSILDVLKTVAKSKSSVLIQGESGTGKELFARFLYRHSNRRDNPFVAVNCAAIPHNLLESEMFGYEKGAFTGAMKSKPGRFELADGGTLLLDEVGEMDIQLQTKLLRVIQESEVDRLGGKSPVPVDVRIIATTNVDLLKAIDEKAFRGDLYYRLNVIPVKIPPLRDRIEDIVLLSEYFIKKYSRINEKPPLRLSEKALAALTAYPWPGNVRELENAMERAVLICDQNEIFARHLFLENPQPEKNADPGIAIRRAETGTTLHDMEKNLIYETLSRVHGNKTQASKILGISVRTMRNKLNEYGDQESADVQDA